MDAVTTETFMTIGTILLSVSVIVVGLLALII
jgi:hypothetical protein